MNSYLIDFENVNSRGLTGIEKLEEGDMVYIFYSDKSDNLSFEMHKMVMQSKAKIEYIKVTVGGKNALDFQLSTFLGYLVAKEIYSHIFVISGDKGFDFLNIFWSEKKTENISCSVFRTKTINGAINFANASFSGNSVNNYEEIEENLEYSAPDIPSDSGNDTVEDIPVSAEFAEIDSAFEETSEENTIEISNSEKEEITYKSDETKSYIDNIKTLLEGCCEADKDIKLIGSLLIQAKGKLDFHNSLRKYFGDNGPIIYQRFKLSYENLRKIYKEEMTKALTCETVVSDKQTQKTKIKSSPKNKSVKNNSKKRSKENKKETTIHKVVSADLSKLIGEYCNDDELKFVSEQMEAAPTKQQLYIRMIKAFKREKGCKIYGAIKDQYTAAHTANMAQTENKKES